MSVQAMAWAIEQQETKDPIARLVLICLANYASADGTSAHPAINRLAIDTGLSERAVQYQLRKLEQRILIRRGNPAIVAAHIPRADRRPTCYELMMKPRGAPYAPRPVDNSATGCTPRQNGVHQNAERGAPGAPDPSLTINDPKSARANPTGSCAEASKENREAFKARLRTLASKKFER